MDTLIIIPARVASSRLPRKMLADIGGLPLIARTYLAVKEAEIGDVIVACDSEEIAEAITSVGGRAIVTDPALQSGTDRVFAGYIKYDLKKKFEYVINVQGDLPFLDPEFVRAAVEVVKGSTYDISTLATTITDDSYLKENVVKPVIAFKTSRSGQALYFSRSPIPFSGPFYQHVGIYCFKIAALKKFVALPQGRLEKIEKLEQLRALENGMTIGIKVVDRATPISVDTREDYEAALEYFEAHKQDFDF